MGWIFDFRNNLLYVAKIISLQKIRIEMPDSYTYFGLSNERNYYKQS